MSELSSIVSDSENLYEQLLQIESSQFKTDGRLVNAVTRIGMEEDPSTHTKIPELDLLTDTQVENLYSGHDLCATVCEFYPYEMVREGISVSSGETTDSRYVAWLTKQFEQLNVYSRVREALTWGNVYGGSAILLKIDDGLPYDQPVDVDNIRRVSKLIVKDKTEIYPQNSVFSNTYEPEYYRLNMGDNILNSDLSHLRKTIKDRDLDLIHSSRVLRFDGVKVPKRIAQRNNGWGISVLCRFHDAYTRYETAIKAVETMIQKFEIPILGIQNLVGKLAKEEGAESKLYSRLKVLAMSIKNLGAIVIDKDKESADYLTRSLTGIAEILDRFAYRVISSASIPETLLFGRSSKGSGLSDSGLWERFYVSQITKSKQEAHLREPLHNLIRYILASQENPFSVPDFWGFTFNDTLQLSPKELADLKESQANVDQTEIEMGVVTPEEIRLSRHGGSRWSPNTILLRDASVKDLLNKKELANEDPSDSTSEEITKTDSKFSFNDIDRTVPESVKKALRRGIKKHEAGLSGSGLEPATIREAKSLIAGKLPTKAKIKKMFRFFARNKRFKNLDKESAGYVSWLLWGGSAGMSWARKLYKQVLKAEGRDVKKSSTKTDRMDDDDFWWWIPEDGNLNDCIEDLEEELGLLDNEIDRG